MCNADSDELFSAGGVASFNLLFFDLELLRLCVRLYSSTAIAITLAATLSAVLLIQLSFLHLFPQFQLQKNTLFVLLSISASSPMLERYKKNY